jgi:hypothetical protein
MASDNNTEIIFAHPIPEGAIEKLQRIIDAHELSDEDWDGDVAKLVEIQKLAPGIITLFGRNVDWESGTKLIELAKQHDFSVIISTEDHADYESGNPNFLRAHEKGTHRLVECACDFQGPNPLVPLCDAVTMSREELMHEYALPVDLMPTVTPA